MLIIFNFDEWEDVHGYGYGGATGPKACKIYQDSIYLIKRQERIHDNQYDISYVNDPLSEYIGSHIYKICGIPVHETLLGIYKGRLAVACKDFTIETGLPLVEFRYLKNTIVEDDIEYDISGMSRSLESIMRAINYLFEGTLLHDTLQRFYQQFVIDSLIGNCDRNNGNWGYLRSTDNTLILAPIYDCGGCLNYRRPDYKLKEDIVDSNRLNNLALNYTLNFTLNGKLVNPFHYIEHNLDNEFIQSGLSTVKTIDMNSVFSLIDSLCDICIPERIEYYKRILSLRYDKLLSLTQKIPSNPLFDAIPIL